jgi:hypothetical protein
VKNRIAENYSRRRRGSSEIERCGLSVTQRARRAMEDHMQMKELGRRFLFEPRTRRRIDAFEQEPPRRRTDRHRERTPIGVTLTFREAQEVRVNM